MYTKLEEEHVMCCRICRSSFVEKKVYGVVPSLIKGNVLTPNSITTEDSGLFRGWCAVFRSDKDFT